MEDWLVELGGGKSTQQRGMEAAAEKGEELSHSAYDNERMNERMNE
jgi:hypothetical protein